ncbi:MAG: alpha/beta hydrolase [Chitinophagaceae bacterium]|nr:alpha/beta hydrolase [Chitinophagaceae bacterium]
MTRHIFSLIKYVLLLCLVVYLFCIFWPRTYDVPHLQKRAGTKFWNLSTGSRIGYTLIQGKGKKKPYPIIYLHGGPGGFVSDNAIKILTPLANDGFDIYFYDQVGGGQSSRLKNINEYRPDRHEEDLEEIAKQIGAKKLILIGQSWGAILATLFIADNPTKVDRVIFIGPGPIPPMHRELANLKSPDSLQLKEPFYSNRQGNEIAHNLRTKFLLTMMNSLGAKIASDKESDDFATYLNSFVNRSTVCDTAKIPPAEAGGSFHAQVMTMKHFNDVNDPRPAIKKLNIPVLVMKGQCDNQKWGYTNEYLQLFTNHQLVIIPGAGHFIFLEQPDIYLQTIRNFLNK